MPAGVPISEPELLARLAMGEREFEDYFFDLVAKLPARPFRPELLERALDYPWQRPTSSYRLDAGRVEPLGEMTAEEREDFVADLVHGEDRVPLLAIGSNAAPAPLTVKLANLEHPEDRSLTVLSGRLHGFDIGAAAQLALYGSLPATPFPSPGTAVAAAVLWVTPTQLTQLAWTEVNYRLGWLEARFEVDGGGGSVERALVFVSRFGSFAPDGEPLALAAIPAAGRRAPALSQGELLDRAAALALGPEAGAADLVRGIVEDPGATARRVAEHVWPVGVLFAHRHWAPIV